VSQKSVSGTDSRAARHRGMVTETEFKVSIASLSLLYSTVIKY
jgi:hypothetical protein